jgi:tetratricopeptide (TPR) repeat protein
MIRAINLIRDREAGGREFGRMMNGINTIVIRLVYSDTVIRLPPLDLSATHNYTRIIREAERGSYLRPAAASTDFFEYILPFLAVDIEPSHVKYRNALEDLRKAGEMNPRSILPSYFSGLIYERTGRFAEAETAFRKAYEISDECYPAMIGLARIMRSTGRREEAAAFFADLVIRYPDSLEIKRQLAITHFENRDWSRAEAIVDEVLRNNPRDLDFLLMKSRILIEQGQFSQAQVQLDTIASINPNNRLYLFLRARLQAEGNRNRDSAINFLRSIFRTNPNDEEALIYAVRLLMESQRVADQTEGRELLVRLQQIAGNSIEVQSLSLRDAVNRESWQEAQRCLNSILAVRREPQNLVDAYHVERALGNNARALTFARELYERNTSNNEYIVIYISALIDNGRRDEASWLLENSFRNASEAAVKSQYHFLRSRLRTNDDAALGDLRSSLFEDPRNLQALIAMFEIYHRRREERRALYYLRQALAIYPNHPALRNYEREYAHLLNR